MSTDKLVEERIRFLRQEIEKHNYQYYVLDRPLITDIEYDNIFRELVELENDHPEFDDPNSPTKRIGGGLLPGLEKHAHTTKMYSLDNINSVHQLDNWLEGFDDSHILDCTTFWGDVKMDGLALEVIYERGQLTMALTRGDGLIGEIVTDAARTIRNLPLYLRTPTPPDRVEIRGEVVMTNKDFKALNELRQSFGEKPFANPRNAAAGSLRTLDLNIVAKRRLRFYAHSVAYHTGSLLTSHVQIMHQLSSFGFELPPLGRHLKANQLQTYFEEVQQFRNGLPIEIDGVVFKANEFETQEVLGFSNRAPHWAIAYKFPSFTAVTEVLDIEISVGRTGALTPVAVLKPVPLGGVVISRANLHNEEEIKIKDIRIGDFVVLQRACDVIPDIDRVEKELRPPGTVPYQFPAHCPACGTLAEQINGEAVRRCVNISCPAVKLRIFMYMVSKQGVHVNGLGPFVLNQLIEKNLVQDIADLFTLSVDDLMTLDRIGKSGAEKIIYSIQQAKKSITLHKFIRMLGIRHVGDSTAKTLATAVNNVDELMRVTVMDLTRLPDIGGEVATSIVAFFNNEQNRRLLEKFKALGIWPTKNNEHMLDVDKNNPLYGKHILITGTLEHMTRSEAIQKATRMGAFIAPSIRKGLDMVVVGTSPSDSKLEKATRTNIPQINEQKFLSLLGSAS